MLGGPCFPCCCYLPNVPDSIEVELSTSQPDIYMATTLGDVDPSTSAVTTKYAETGLWTCAVSGTYSLTWDPVGGLSGPEWTYDDGRVVLKMRGITGASRDVLWTLELYPCVYRLKTMHNTTPAPVVFDQATMAGASWDSDCAAAVVTSSNWGDAKTKAGGIRCQRNPPAYDFQTSSVSRLIAEQYCQTQQKMRFVCTIGPYVTIDGVSYGGGFATTHAMPYDLGITVSYGKRIATTTTSAAFNQFDPNVYAYVVSTTGQPYQFWSVSYTLRIVGITLYYTGQPSVSLPIL